MRKSILLAVLLGGCTSVEPLRPDMAARVTPSRLEEIAYINALRSALTFEPANGGACYDGANLKYFRPTLEQGYPNHTSEQEAGPEGRCVKFRELESGERVGAIRRYLEAGFGLTDMYCTRFFAIASESAQKRKFQRNAGSTADTLVNAVLGVAGAGETALAVANAGFEAIDSTYQNIGDSFLVAPELENVEKLVNSAQQDYRTRAFATLPSSYEGARSVIGGYAKHCTYTGMKQLVNDSVTAQTKALSDVGDKNKTNAAGAGTSTTTSNNNNATGTTAAPTTVTRDASHGVRTDASILVPASPQ
jgi:hypothetical protein